MGRDAGKCPAGVVRRRQVGQLMCPWRIRSVQLRAELSGALVQVRTGPVKRAYTILRDATQHLYLLLLTRINH
jgi:hypothetical protein